MKIMDVVKGALRNPTRHTFGRCSICGHRTIFICTDRRNHGNNMYCPFCVSSARKRHVARALLEVLDRDELHLAAIPPAELPRIYNTDDRDAFSRIIRGQADYTASMFQPDVELGKEIRPGVTCQNLEALTFQDESFDVVISEEVFEHVRHYEAGFREVYRVLKPGGFHIFTIPFNYAQATVARVDTSGPEDVFLLPKHYHGDKIRGRILVYTDFGYDLFPFLESLGFENEVRNSTYFDHQWGVFDSRVFISRKPDGGKGA